MILAKGMTAPRIKPEDLDAALDPAVPPQFHVFPGTTTTVCLITLKNGFTLTGESSCADPSNFDEKIGREVAFKEARNKLWPLLGFMLKESLARNKPEAGEYQDY
jgi:hypothetical protein